MSVGIEFNAEKNEHFRHYLSAYNHGCKAKKTFVEKLLEILLNDSKKLYFLLKNIKNLVDRPNFYSYRGHCLVSKFFIRNFGRIGVL